MLARPPLVDGLWLCLRPALGRPDPKRPTNLSSRTQCVLPPHHAFSRPSSTHQSLTPNGENPGERIPDPNRRGARNQPDFSIKVEKRKKRYSPSDSFPETWTPPNQQRLRDSSRFELTGQTVNWLENKLQDVVAPRPNYINAVRIARELLGVHGVRPAPRHYRALLLANAEALRGNPTQVRKLLEEMEENAIALDSGVLHAALKALAIHPDFILRQEVLRKMHDRWISLSPAGWHNVVTGYVRERQYEMALNTLAHMEAQNVPVNDWMYSLLIYNLCDAEEFDEALRLMRQRLGAAHQLSPNVWFRVLDLASDALHEEMTSFVWSRRVETGYINPSYGVCNNVLTIASRSGNVALATSVFRILSERRSTFMEYDYEALIDTYATAGDIESAFRMVCVMDQTGIGASERSTRSIITKLVWTKPEPMAIWKILQKLSEEEKRTIPIAAANVIIELCASQDNAEEAMNIYRGLHLVCPHGATTETYNHLFRVCIRAKRTDMANFFLDEMHLAKVLPDRVTYEMLIVICVYEECFVDARNYLVEMTQAGFALSHPSRIRIQRACAKSQSEDAQLLQLSAEVRQPISRRIDPKVWQNATLDENRPVGTIPGAGNVQT